MKNGDRVILVLIDPEWDVDKFNPLYGTRYECIGTIDHVFRALGPELELGVKWDNGKHNAYREKHLKVINEKEELFTDKDFEI